VVAPVPADAEPPADVGEDRAGPVPAGLGEHPVESRVVPVLALGSRHRAAGRRGQRGEFRRLGEEGEDRRHAPNPPWWYNPHGKSGRRGPERELVSTAGGSAPAVAFRETDYRDYTRGVCLTGT